MSQARKILVVDDEPLNLEILAEYLDGPDFALSLFESADDAWAHLSALPAGASYDLALLDRMMPGMDGIQLLTLIKADPRFRAMQVVMQTAAASPQEVREGIAAGAYYYLAKPYSATALLAIVRSALAELPSPETMASAASTLLPEALPDGGARYAFASLSEARVLAKQLAELCPHAELTALGLSELLVNAVEHGNLGITYDEKTKLRMQDCWEEEVERRLTLPEYADRVATVQVERGVDEIVFTVSDCGQGFDWRKYLLIDPARAYDPNGRGIAMARQLSFSSLEYRGCGNIAVAVVKLPDELS